MSEEKNCAERNFKLFLFSILNFIFIALQKNASRQQNRMWLSVCRQLKEKNESCNFKISNAMPKDRFAMQLSTEFSDDEFVTK